MGWKISKYKVKNRILKVVNSIIYLFIAYFVLFLGNRDPAGVPWGVSRFHGYCCTPVRNLKKASTDAGCLQISAMFVFFF